LGRLLRIRHESPGLEEQCLPDSKRPALVVRKTQSVRRRRRMHGRDRLEVCVERGNVRVGNLGEFGVWKGRIKMCAIGTHALTQGTRELFAGPLADAGLGVLGDISRVKRSIRGLKRNSTGKSRATLPSVTARAIANLRQIAPTRDFIWSTATLSEGRKWESQQQQSKRRTPT